jgi:hypothetical protein
MKIAAKISAAVASTLALVGAGAVHAAAIAPSTNDGSLMFFLTDTKTNQTYTAVLSQDLNSLFSPTQATSPAPTAGVVNVISGDAGFTDPLAGDGNLTTFLASAGSDTLNWGILSEAYVGTGSAARPIGAARTLVTDLLASDVLNVSQNPSITTANPSGFATDVTNLNVALGASGTSVIAATPSIGGNNGDTLNSIYGSQLNASGIGVGSSVVLYGVSGNGKASGLGYAYDVGTVSFSLSNDSVVFTGNSGGGGSTVPLPAAVWLFGSGLLGLAGVGRRRSVGVAQDSAHSPAST